MAQRESLEGVNLLVRLGAEHLPFKCRDSWLSEPLRGVNTNAIQDLPCIWWKPSSSGRSLGLYYEKLPISTSFFKVLIPGFEQALRLPPTISRMLNNAQLPEAAILVTVGGSWKVGVGQGSKDRITFHGEGWDSFIRDHDLSVGDFLVFEQGGDMHFNTLVFDSTAIDKLFPITSENEKDKGADDHSPQAAKSIKKIEGKRDQAAASHQQKDALFQIKLHRYSVAIPYPFLCIPPAFIKSNELSDKTMATLINPSGDTWQVHLKLRSDGYRTVMNRAWNEFVKENKLKVGDVCVFKLNQSLEKSDTAAVMNVQFPSM